MSENSLSPQAIEIIQNYLILPFSGHNINCPYFNNRRLKLRGGLRAIIGKGSPKDIVEEATIISLRDKTDLTKLSDEELKKFLVNNHLGIDCSGLAYHILDSEMQAKGLKSLQHILRRPWFKNPLRKILVKLRPIENTGVGTFNHEANSFEIQLKDIQPGDMIIILNAGAKQDYNHILLVHKITTNNDQIAVIEYTHSFQYSSDGLYNHGVRQESITITDPNKNILEQNWSEPQMRDYARGAKEIKTKRLKNLG